jgi:hypothetical protein
MPEKQPTLLLTQTVDGTWTVSVVANLSQGIKRAVNMAKEATVQQCVAVPVVLAALAPKMKDLLAGHVDIDAMMQKVETAEEVVSAPGECQRCGVPHSPEGLVKCSNCTQYICPGCNSNQGIDCEVCLDCHEQIEKAEAELAADLEAEGKTEA